MKQKLIIIFFLGFNIFGFSQSNKQYTDYNDLIKSLDTIKTKIKTSSDCRYASDYSDIICEFILLLDSDKIDLINNLRPNVVSRYKEINARIEKDKNKSKISGSTENIKDYFLKPDLKRILLMSCKGIEDKKNKRIYDIYIKDNNRAIYSVYVGNGCTYLYRATLIQKKLLIEFVNRICI